MSTPITRVYDADGNLVHDCAEAGCAVSWDGYALASGEPAEGRAEPGEQWDTRRPGVARLKPPPA